MKKVIAAITFALASSACHHEVSPLVAMADAQHASFPPVIPILRVDNLKAAQRYYTEKLGFQVMWEHGEPPDFGEVKRGESAFFMCQRCQGQTPSWSFIFVDDVDKLHRELASRGARIARAPENEPWGLREMHVVDEDGNVIRFASRGPH
jgi:catechol 2,3-dioxygenase-like lactoylglutathione lyase family enzyme